MAYTVTIHIAPRGTLRRLEDNQPSNSGHMFYTLHDGSSSTLSSHGFAPEGHKDASDGWTAPGEASSKDYHNYDRSSTKSYTLEITNLENILKNMVLIPNIMD